MNLTNSKAWVAITIGVAIVGVAWFAWQGDGNAGGVYSLAEQRSRLSWAGMDRCEGGDFDGRIVP